MTIDVAPGHFTGLEDAIAEIRSDGLHFVEAKVAPDRLTGEAHVHAFSVDIYMLEGVFELHEPGTGRTHRLEAGTKAVVPAQTLHSEYTPAGFRAAIGLSVEPDSIDQADPARSTSAR